VAGHGNGCYFVEAIPLDFLIFEITDADQNCNASCKVGAKSASLALPPYPGLFRPGGNGFSQRREH